MTRADIDHITEERGHLMFANRTNIRLGLCEAGSLCLFAVGLCLAALLVPTPSAHANTACPNEAVRQEQGEAALALPECRAYEQVSPSGTEPYLTTLGTNNGNTEKAQQTTLGLGLGQLASAKGNSFAFYSSVAPAGSTTDGPFYLARRGATDWSTENLIPPQNVSFLNACLPAIDAWSPELDVAVLADGWNTGNVCGADEPSLVAGEPRGAQNLFIRSADGSYRLINLTPAGVRPGNAEYVGSSPDLTHVVFRERASLTPDAPFVTPGSQEGFANVYEYFAGTLRLITVFPDGVPTSGAFVVEGTANFSRSTTTGEAPVPQTRNVVSADGERVLWETHGEIDGIVGPDALYLRLNAGQPPTASGSCDPVEPELACTVRVDAVAGGTGQGEPAPIFRFASVDGSRVLFTDEQNLTPGSNAAPGSPDLYEYQLDPANPLESTLLDLTPNQPESSDVLGLAGISEDSSSVYFAAAAALTPPSEENDQGEHALAGQPNLYLRRDGNETYIATLAWPDRCVWSEFSAPGTHEVLKAPGCLTARVSPDGRFLAFTSMRPLTGSTSTPAAPIDCISQQHEPEDCQEIFLYDASDGALSCASCAPDGSLPTGPATIYPRTQLFLPNQNPGLYLQPKNLSNTGIVFFDTKSPLLPADENGVSDVYEFARGKLSLVSSGKSPAPSFFYEASESGEDVFFTTTQGLVRSDTAGDTSIYDARVDGGFPEPPPPPSCEGESCRGAPTQFSAPASPATPSFSGPEEGPKKSQAPSCKKGFVKKAGKCVKKPSKQNHHKAKKKKKKHTHKQNGKQAGDNRRAGK